MDGRGMEEPVVSRRDGAADGIHTVSVDPRPAGEQRFFSEVRAEVEEFLTTGSMRRAVELARATGEPFNHDIAPMFFTGDPEGRLVLVHLNPRHTPGEAPIWLRDIRTVEGYLDRHRHFGRDMYGPGSTSGHRSAFDHKQVAFLRPFGLVDLPSGEGLNDRQTNLVRVCDDKLQLELVPYGSARFSTHRFTVPLLEPHYRRVMDIVTAHPRAVLLFCGKVFDTLLAPFLIARSDFSFRLRKADGADTSMMFKFSNVALRWGEMSVIGGIAPHFGVQGAPIAEYGRACAARYGSPARG